MDKTKTDSLNSDSKDQFKDVFLDKYPFVAREYKKNRAVLSTYIHIPFCRRKCSYCDFVSFDGLQREKMRMSENEYVDLLCSEIRQEACRSILHTKLEAMETIYFGGGTPSLLTSKSVEKIISTIDKEFQIKGDAELSFEMNPEGVDIDYLRDLKSLGINRLSLGMQTADDKQLKFLGRAHSVKDFVHQVENARQVGFDNLSSDIILALPHQTLSDINKSVRLLCQLSLEHISAYSLILEEGTFFYELHKKGKLQVPSEEEEREMVHYFNEYLRGEGYYQYEISNYAKTAKQSRHNSTYWLNEYYYGFGLNASSYTFASRKKRTARFTDYRDEIQNKQEAKIEEVQTYPTEAITEYLAFAPRLIRPFAGSDFERRFKRKVSNDLKICLESLKERGFLQYCSAEENKGYILTELGKDYADYVSREVLFAT